MKKGVWIPGLSVLDGVAMDAIDYLYLGSELCPRRIPSSAEIEDVVERAANKVVVLVTPVLSLATEQLVKGILRKVSLYITEIVVNDWGVLEYLQDLGYTGEVHIGRLLRHGRGDPRIAMVQNYLPEQMVEYFWRPPWNASFLAALKKEFPMVCGIEYDYPLHGLTLEKPALMAGFCYAMHSPYIFVAGGRWCPFLLPDQKQYYAGHYINRCTEDCKSVYSVLRNPEFGGHDLLYNGNSLMVRNDRKECTDFTPDRIIDNTYMFRGRV